MMLSLLSDSLSFSLSDLGCHFGKIRTNRAQSIGESINASLKSQVIRKQQPDTRSLELRADGQGQAY